MWDYKTKQKKKKNCRKLHVYFAKNMLAYFSWVRIKYLQLWNLVVLLGEVPG